MTHLIITRWNSDGYLNKFQDNLTEIEAIELLERIKGKFPDAFIVSHPIGGGEVLASPEYYIVDSDDKSIRFDQVTFDSDNLVEQMSILRDKRNSLLQVSDNHVHPDQWASMNDAAQNKWASYRQALRDLPANTADPTNITWPEKP